MHRIDSSGATVNNLFQQGNPAQGTPATTVTPEWLNDIQESLARLVERAGISLSKGDYDQLWQAFEYYGVASGLKGYATKAAMDADLNPGENTVALVTNDATADNNWTYRKSGASGTGSWIKAATDRVGAVEQTAAFPVGGKLPFALDPLTYNHPRGDSELNESTANFYANTALAVHRYFPRGVTFDEIQIFARTSALTTPVTLYLYESSVDPVTVAKPWNLAAQTLLHTQVLDTSSGWFTTISKKTISLGASISVANGKYLVVAFLAPTSNQVGLTRWTTNTPGDRAVLLYSSNRDLNFLAASSGYWAGSFKLYNRGTLETRVTANETQISSLTTIANQGYYLHGEAATDSEMTGNGQYSLSTMGGFYAQMTGAGRGNAVRGRIWGAGTAAVDYRVFVRPTSATFDPSTVNPVASGTIALGTFPTASGLHTFQLKNFSWAAGQWLFILFRAQDGSKIYHGQWGYVEGVSRVGFPFSLTTGGAWPTVVNFGSYGPGLDYGMTGFQIMNQLDELRKVGVGSAAAITFDPTGTWLAGTTVQAAVAEVASKTVAPRIILPDEITAVVGDTLQVFHRGVLEKPSVGKNDLNATCSIGADFPRYFEVTPVIGDVGTKTLSFSSLGNDGNQISAASTSLVVVNPTAQPASQVNVLCFGDSLTNGGAWPIEFWRRIAGTGGSPAGKGYGNFNMIGDNISGNAKWVGYGGWTWNAYLGNGAPAYWVTCAHSKTAADQKAKYVDANANVWILETIEAGRIKFVPYSHSSAMPAATNTMTWQSGGTNTATITYTAIIAEASTPFWNAGTSQPSFASFVAAQGAPGLDIVYALLGWNGLPGANKSLASDHATVIGNARTLLNVLRAEYPSCKIRLLGLQIPSPFGGLGTNYGANTFSAHYYELVRTVNGYNLALQALAKEAAFSAVTRYIGVAAQFDSEYNMIDTAKAVNTRSATTELFQTNGVHPDTEGYNQIADVVFRDFIRTYCS